MTWFLPSVAGLLALLLVLSATMKLSGRPDVVDSYRKVGVKPAQLPVLAVLLLLGAAGLVAGFVWPVLGLAAALCLVAYFALAIVAHATHHDLRRAPVPAGYLILAALAVVVFR